MKEFLEEIFDEAGDFFEDIFEHFLPIKRHEYKEREVEVGGVIQTVRPAYVFAERIDNTLKLIFGISICMSALTATIFGYIKLSDLVEALLGSIGGRIIIFIIGLSYLIMGLWKLLHTGKAK